LDFIQVNSEFIENRILNYNAAILKTSSLFLHCRNAAGQRGKAGFIATKPAHRYRGVSGMGTGWGRIHPQNSPIESLSFPSDQAKVRFAIPIIENPEQKSFRLIRDQDEKNRPCNMNIRTWTMKKTVLITALLFSAGTAMAEDTASWATWSGTSATFAQNSQPVNVTYTGQWDSVDFNASYFNSVPTSFTSAEVTNTPGSNGAIHMTGGSPDVNTLHFSQPVINPLIAVYSVGQSGLPVTFNFLNNPSFVIASQGPGHWGGGSLTQSGNTVTGLEGNGLLQFTGSYTDIAFTTPVHENFYGFTVGAIATVPAVPEPETYAMLLAGLGLMGFIARRRKAA
jgi:hypothetical protein